MTTAEETFYYASLFVLLGAGASCHSPLLNRPRHWDLQTINATEIAKPVARTNAMITIRGFKLRDFFFLAALGGFSDIFSLFEFRILLAARQ